ncbi:MAG TPA: GNAT family N-acetyltransferase [Acidimicrobiales bacterium]|nr:GNAT family N-acetyltransferase [Acidimicrobiales bacterium]
MASPPLVVMAPGGPEAGSEVALEAEVERRARDVRDRLDLSQQERLSIRSHVAGKQVTVDEASVYSWESQVSQYPATGPAGTGAMRVTFQGGTWVNCILHRGDDGGLLGILNHYPVDIPPYERANSLNVWVRPDHRGRGIATAMVLAALEHGWAVDLEEVAVTGPGLALTRSVARRVRRDVEDDGSPGEAAVPVVTLRSAGDGPAGDGPAGDGPAGDGPAGDGPAADRAADVRTRLALDEAAIEAVQRHLGAIGPSVDPGAMQGWETQAGQYPAAGPPGISTSTVPLPRGTPVNCLLYRAEDGGLIGILNHYPVDVPPYERANSVNVWVHPRHRGRGVAAEMVLAALQQGWPIDLDRQRMTAEGLALARSVARRVVDVGPAGS